MPTRMANRLSELRLMYYVREQEQRLRVCHCVRLMYHFICYLIRAQK